MTQRPALFFGPRPSQNGCKYLAKRPLTAIGAESISNYAGIPAGMGADEGRLFAHVNAGQDARDDREPGLEPNKGAASRTASRLVMTSVDPASGAADFERGGIHG